MVVTAPPSVDRTYFIPNSTFDPYQQDLTLVYPDGVHALVANVDDIVYFMGLAVKSTLIFAIQIGISFVLMLVIALLTKPERRVTLVFFLNMTALFTIFIRAILMCTTFVGTYYNFYNWIMGNYPNSGLADRVSIAAEVFAFLIILSLELSMMFQVRIVCINLSSFRRRIITFSSIVVAMIVCTVRFALMVLSCDWRIVNIGDATQEKNRIINRVASGYNICTIASIIFFNTIFVSKLAVAIKHRRSMGMKQFGPMQIIFVMGCQTLLIPAIFGIISYFALASTQVYSLMPMVVAIFLPLSSMWASFNTNKTNSVTNMRQPNVYRPNMIIGQDTTQNSGKNTNISGTSNSTATTSSFASDKRRLNLSFNTQGTLVNSISEEEVNNPQKLGPSATVAVMDRDSLELEMRQHGIAQGRSYSVRSD
ncbi:unnamed protein product [Zymoseptoria tritici ST99CH_3D7]|uniref:Pheremone receptor n=2 Tax=Zymoseptoria tritici TaxID=1047171 RepID=F9X131_ZYMTI|nr:pheromone receptor [Zymoseptoria tritici IPO323]EGP92304.1 pheremone receptor [Zymoseptoria tritici IPO323]SMQ45983.1 unnamed protein product [Zymoseptoria tritici ST99CH_3D7]